MCVSQLQPDLTLRKVTFGPQQLLGDVVDLFLGSSTEVLQSVHQRPLSPKTVNLPMKTGITLYHEGLVYRKLVTIPDTFPFSSITFHHIPLRAVPIDSYLLRWMTDDRSIWHYSHVPMTHAYSYTIDL